MDIGLMIARERTKMKLTRAELAKKVGCTTRAIEYWEKNKRNIKLDYLDAILKVLNVTMKIGAESDLDIYD